MHFGVSRQRLEEFPFVMRLPVEADRAYYSKQPSRGSMRRPAEHLSKGGTKLLPMNTDHCADRSQYPVSVQVKRNCASSQKCSSPRSDGQRPWDYLSPIQNQAR